MTIAQNINSYAIKTTLRGLVWFEPKYGSNNVDEDNYLIDALPPLPLPKDIIENWGFPKLPSDEDRKLGISQRRKKVRDIKQFILPLENFVKIALEIPYLIREGYKARNPMNHDFLQRIDILRRQATKKSQSHYASFFNNINEVNSNLRSTADIFTILGISGVGKSTAVELALLSHPQVIIHSTYKGEPCPVREQILWVKLECPSTRKNLCREFFSVIDNILSYKGRDESPNYSKKFVNVKSSTDELVDSLKVVVCNHAIGVLVIDEIQHLLNEGNDKDEILNFLVQLENKVGIPIVLIGTPRANPILTKELMTSRRACGDGAIIWDRMKRDEEWDKFIRWLWGHQWTEDFVPLDDNLKEAMYEYSQGITAIAINLFRLAQERAILFGKKRLSILLFRQVALKELSLVRPMIEALKSGKLVLIRQYSDLDLSSLNDINCGEQPEAVYNSVIKTLVTEKKSIINTLTFSLRTSGSIKHLSDRQIEVVCDEAVKELQEGWYEDHSRLCATLTKAILDKEYQIIKQKENKKAKESQGTKEEGDLRRYFEKAQSTEGSSVYDILKSEGFIKEPTELFEG